jgi:hypothetical protein
MLRFGHFVAGAVFAAAATFVCPAQDTPSIFSPEGAARVTQLTGRVSILKDSTEWALHAGSIVSVKQVIITGADGYAVLQVSDGSTFEVFPNSQVVFRDNPANWRDLLNVFLGRVKVHIQRLGGQPNHNKVKTPTAVISVRGTVFDVVVEDETSTLVSVEEGQVEVRHSLLPSAKLVNAGEYLRVYRDQPLAQTGSPRRAAAVQHGLRAAVEALYRVIYRNPAPTAGGGVPTPTPTGGGGGAPLPGDTESTPPPPPPPPND